MCTGGLSLFDCTPGTDRNSWHRAADRRKLQWGKPLWHTGNRAGFLQGTQSEQQKSIQGLFTFPLQTPEPGYSAQFSYWACCVIAGQELLCSVHGKQTRGQTRWKGVEKPAAKVSIASLAMSEGTSLESKSKLYQMLWAGVMNSEFTRDICHWFNQVTPRIIPGDLPASHKTEAAEARTQAKPQRKLFCCLAGTVPSLPEEPLRH